MGKNIYFVSDLHFAGQKREIEQKKEQKFASFLQEIKDDADILYIVGDLFDFWFEYRYAINKNHFSVLHHLKNFIDYGVKVVYIAGNHDFSLDTFLEKTMGINVCNRPIQVDHQGYTIFIAHGDGLISKDRGYKILKKFLRFPLNIWLYKLVHPDFGYYLAHRVSQRSRKYSGDKKFNLTDELRLYAQEKFKEGCNAALFGHSHTPILENLNGKYYLNSGNWTHIYSYIVLSKGEFYLRYWDRD